MQQKRQNQRQQDFHSMIYGKVPPQAIAVETQLLGIIMMTDANNHCLYEIRQLLKTEDFYVDAHQKIYGRMLAMADMSQKIDMVLLADELKRAGELDLVGGLFSLSKITDSVRNDVGYLQYARIIKQYSIARKLIRFSGEVMNKAYDDDPFDSLEFAQAALFEIFEEIKTTQITDLTSIAINAIIKTMESSDDEVPVLTGMEAWDKINGNMFPGLYVIAARPGMGKTAFLVEVICRMAKRLPVGFINGEMTDEQMANRIVCNLVEFPNFRYKVPKDEWTDEWRQHYKQGIEEFVNLKLFMYSDSQKIEDVSNMIRFYVKRLGAKIILIDYLQIMTIAAKMGSYMTKTDRIDYILEVLRGLTKELKTPIILLSQLNREVYKRAGSHRPNLSDLKGSGTIEESAFQISFLHRPEYYSKDNEDASVVDEMGESIRGLCYQYIDKHRDGELAELKWRFIPKYSKFEKWEDEYSNFNPMDVVKSEYSNDYINDLPEDQDPF